MATYTHHEFANSPSAHWVDVMKSDYTTATSVAITIPNTDGTLTKLAGAFAVLNGVVFGGTITALDRTSANGAQNYESIDGVSVDVNVFLQHTNAARFAEVFKGADSLFGFSGNDFLQGYAQTSTMFGKDGDDTYVVMTSGDIVIENANDGFDTVKATNLFKYTLPGNVEKLQYDGFNQFHGIGNGLGNTFVSTAAGYATYEGLGGDDTFHVVGGFNNLFGGPGDDTYFITSQTDKAVEKFTEGYEDKVSTSLNNYILPDYIEQLYLTGNAGLTGTGNSGFNLIYGTSKSDKLYGLGGNDELHGGGGSNTLVGGEGDDTYFVESPTDTIVELPSGYYDTEGHDTVKTLLAGYTLPENVEDLIFLPGPNVARTGTGNSLANKIVGVDKNDKLYGNGGDDTLDGGTGADTMAGGAGNDSYYVDNAGDVVIENANEGDGDTVRTTLSTYTLGANVETLLFSTDGPHTGYGNELDNGFFGGLEKDTFFGYGGNDSFGGLGGGDTFIGGTGDDGYAVRAGDTVIELPGEGTDRIDTFLPNYTLPANVEKLFYNGSGSSAYGNELDNTMSMNGGSSTTLYGLGGNDWLRSTGGSDTLYGGDGDDELQAFYGHDTMVGGSGSDTFVIQLGNHVITDFSAGAGSPDRIDLEEFKPGGVNFGQNMFVTFADVLAHATQNGADTVIDLGVGYSLTLQNVQVSSLSGEDFVGLTVVGSDADDSLPDPPGDNTIEGGTGDDTAVFSQPVDQYTVTDLGGTIVVSGPDGTDTLTGVEHLQFAGGTITPDDGDPLFDTVFYLTHNPDVFQAGVNALDHFNQFGWHEGRDPNAFFSVNGYLATNTDVAAAGINPLEHYRQNGWHEGRDPGANFDTALYLDRNADVESVGIDPLEHYLQYGRAEGRAAYQAIGTAVNGFDAEYYLLHNPDVAAAGIDPLAHFNAFGWQEGRNPNAWFDTSGYLAHYGDVAVAGINPLDHYEQIGWTEGRDPSAAFDTIGYLTANQDVAAAGANPLDHFINHGIYEGRLALTDGLWH